MKETNRNLPMKYVLLLMIAAYAFSFLMRMIWVWQFQDNPNFIWNNQLMINTNDGYFFAAGVQKVLEGMHMSNPRVPEIWAFGTVAVSAFLVQVTPFSIETIILYMPAIISSIVVVPMILIGRLYNQELWGFLAALLGSVAWSYYNRTMVGYYDTDMFSAMAPMFILYFFIKSTIDYNLRSALYAALFISIYPFLYDQGKSIVYTMGMIYAMYLIYYHRKDEMTYLSLILVFIALLPLPLVAPTVYFVKVGVLLLVYVVLKNTSLNQRILMLLSAILFMLFALYGNMFSMILGKAMSYVSTGTATEGLHFYGVKQTIREAGNIPFSTFANRISGSQLGLIFALMGYIFLVIRYRAFILALPLVAIGIFALWGGLRFTVYVVPLAALAAVYLFFILGDFFKNKKMKYGFVILATLGMLYPNIQHIIGYRVPTVLNKAEVTDLDKLKSISNVEDYTLTWWDYGYPIWYYSETSTLIDGGKHNNDNFIISKIMQTTSPELAANLSRLAVETYVDSNYEVVANTLFKNGEKDQIDPNFLLSELETGTYDIPEKTRDVYLYLPYRMLRIFPTVAVFGNLDLETGKKQRDISFYPTTATKNDKGILTLRNGVVFNSLTGDLTIANAKKSARLFIKTQNTADKKTIVTPKRYPQGGDYAVVYMSSYRQFIVMDIDTFNSMYVQMFILGKYDKNLFELVVSSPYSKIYKLK